MLVPWSPHLDTLLQQLVPHYIISLYSQHTCNCFVFANSDIATLFLFFVFYILNLFFFLWLSTVVNTLSCLSSPPAPVIPKFGEGRVEAGSRGQWAWGWQPSCPL